MTPPSLRHRLLPRRRPRPHRPRLPLRHRLAPTTRIQKKAVLEKCTPNSGDTAWMLTSVALVLMMTIPGLGLFYGGMVRKKNVGDTVMTSFAVTCLVTILYACVTYSMSFTTGGPFLGGFSRVFPARHLERHIDGHRHAERFGRDDS